MSQSQFSVASQCLASTFLQHTGALVIFCGCYNCHHTYVTEVKVNQQYDKLLTLADIETLLNNTMAES